MVLKMTFDCVEELNKLKQFYPEADCVLRIETIVTTAHYNLSEKYGAEMSMVPKILETAKKLNMRIKGVAFHTGSGGVTINPYEDSIKDARKVFDMA